ncbi:hypothetical protein EMIT0P228_170093 [Pseudomonas brassicacearum]
MAVTCCVKLQCVVTFQVWLKPAGKHCQSRGVRDSKILTVGDLEHESSPYWGLIHLWGVSRIPGSPEPVFLLHGCARRHVLAERLIFCVLGASSP